MTSDRKVSATGDRAVSVTRAERPWGQLAAAVAAVALAGMTFAEAVDAVAVPVVVGAVTPVLVAVAARLRPRPHLGLVVGLQLAAYAVAAAGALHATPELVRAGAVDGWRQILDSTPPAPA